MGDGQSTESQGLGETGKPHKTCSGMTSYECMLHACSWKLFCQNGYMVGDIYATVWHAAGALSCQDCLQHDANSIKTHWHHER